MPASRPPAAHRRRYVVSAQLGLIGSLALLIGLFSLQVTAPRLEIPAPTPQEGVLVPEVLPTRHEEAQRPPPPPVPLPPVAADDLLDPSPEPLPLDRVELSSETPILPPRPPEPPRPQETFEEEIFEIVEDDPVLLGGLAGLAERLRYPEMARRARIEGTVFVRFVVGLDGGVSEAECLSDPGGGLCEAALEAVRQSRFTPGRQRGTPVRVRMSLPVRFRLR